VCRPTFEAMKMALKGKKRYLWWENEISLRRFPKILANSEIHQENKKNQPCPEPSILKKMTIFPAFAPRAVTDCQPIFDHSS